MSSEVALYESPDSVLNIYPYPNLHWLQYADRFKFKIPETIVTKADGQSVCSNCKQLYVGYQDKCIRPRYGYETGWNNYITIGNMMVGEEAGGYNGKVNKSGLYPCNHYCTWTHSNDFNRQQDAFNELNMVIEKMCVTYYHSYLTMDTNDAEKWAFIQKMDMLEIENNQLRTALKEVISRINSGGAGLMGHISL